MTEPVAENLVIQLTYPGTAALAVVRLQGPAAAGFVARHFNRPAKLRRCVYGRWRDDAGEVLDDVVVVEGDGWFDVNFHGGRRIAANVLEQASAAGFEVVTGRAAFDAAADDEIEAALPLATTELGLRWLLGQPAAWRALVPERVDVGALLADQTLRRMLFPATVAIMGAPNVGKSTLANALFGQERAIVADVPGTTRDWVGGLADLDGVPVVLVDTPGRRQTPDPIEREAIGLSEGPLSRADLVVEVVDATASGTASPELSRRGEEKPWGVSGSFHPVARPQERPYHHPLPAGEGARGGTRVESALRGGAAATPASRGGAAECAAPLLHVANKSDLAEAPAGWLAISAKTGAGLGALVEAIHRGLGVDVSNAHHEIRANLWNSSQEKLLRDGGSRAVSQITHRLGNW